MIKKLGVIALLALVIIPASVLAAGIKGSGAGSEMASGNALKFQQGGDSQSASGQSMFSYQNGIATSDDNGNGDLLRVRTRDQVQTGDQTGNRTRGMLQAGGQLQSLNGAGNQLQSAGSSGDQLQIRDKLQTMSRLRAQLKDGSCGNCTKTTTPA